MITPPPLGGRRIRLVLDGRLVDQPVVRLSGRTLWVQAAAVATRWGAQLDVGEDVLGWRDTRSSRTIVLRRGSPRAELDGGEVLELSGSPDWSDGAILLPVDAVAAAGNARWALDRKLGVLFLTRVDPYLHQVRIVIDPGHGGRESGAAFAAGLTEKALNLAVARRLAGLLLASGAQVALTRSSDRTLSAAQRCRVARQFQASVVVSLHHTGVRGPTGQGVEAYYGRRGDSRRLAAGLVAALAGELGIAAGGVREANFGLLSCLPCPAALTQLTWPLPGSASRPGAPAWARLREALGLLAGLRAYCSSAHVDSVAWPCPPL